MSPGWTTSRPRPKPAVTFDKLPDEILLHIFSLLPLDDMARSALVCTRWYALLKGHEELWRGKQWRSADVEEARRLLAYSAGIPRLRRLDLLSYGENGIRVSWPNAALYIGLTMRWDPSFGSLDTESLVVSSLVARQEISRYIRCVNTRTLRRLCVAEQNFFSPGPIWSSFAPVPSFLLLNVWPVFPVRRRTFPESVHSEDRCYLPDDPVLERRAAVDPEGAAERDAGAAETATCPALEVLNVHCRELSEARLVELCALGPLRVVRIEEEELRDLWALRGLGPHLQELSVADCNVFKPWDFYELRSMTKLRTLRLGKCHLDEKTLRDLTAGMPYLRSLSLNGRELMGCNN